MTQTKTKGETVKVLRDVREHFRSFRHQRWLPVIAVILLATGGLVVAAWIMGTSTRDQILPGVTVGPVALGNLTVAEAEAKLTTALQDFTALSLVVASTMPQEYSVNLDEFGLRPDPTATAEAAYRLTNSTNPFLNSYHRVRNWFRPIQMTMVVRLDRAQFDVALSGLLTQINQPTQNATIVYAADTWVVIPEVIGSELDAKLLETEFLAAAAHVTTDAIHLSPSETPPLIRADMLDATLDHARTLTADPIFLVDVTENDRIELEPALLASWTEVVADAQQVGAITLHLNASKVRAYVVTLAGELDREAVNARVLFENGALTIPQVSRTGRVLAIDPTVQAIEDEFFRPGPDRTITLAFSELQPEVSSDTLSTLGLTELIGQATTSFSGSPANREHNIAIGFSFLTGKLIKPGEDFSVIKALGAVDDTTGYLPELVIKENRTTPEYGGGLCQVSTTLFRAALNTGLEITERRNHSYRVSYYERDVGPGLDATIYLPSPDLKFKNDTPGWILIQGAVDREKDTITFELYGTSDGRVSTISKPTILSQTPAPEPIYTETSDLPKGETKQIEKPHGGAKTVVSYSVSRNGETFHEQTFSSSYRPWPARYLVGTGEPAPAPAPIEPTPTP